ncbi:MAG TPA: translation initiation factor IF-1 [Vicinamibacterales bacterium]|nr:translation initiation factor IF-1 [Vicinamibacterales bacterium]
MKGRSVTGTVLEVLPRALYRVAVEGGREVVAHAASGTGRNFVRLLVGDAVTVELSPRDLSRGRVVRKLN